MNIDIATAFTGKNVLEATKTLLAQLNVAVHTKTTSPVRPSELAPVRNKVVDAALSKVSELYYVGYVGEEIFGGNFAKLPDDYKGMMVFAVEAKGGAAFMRCDLSAITRALNRLSKCAPVLLVVREGDTFSLAVAERTPYVRASMRGEKAGRVVMLRRISVSSPHRGHIDILQRIASHGTTTYEDFYRYLIDNVLSVSVLTKQFYREIQNWYFWALKKDNGVRFPNDLADDSDDEKYNAENMIRLITRLMFTWFMKEKGLVSPELFDTVFLSQALKHFVVGRDAPIVPQSCTYYRAILQNLFFATFNQEIPRRCFIDSKVIDVKRHQVKNYYRNARFFREKDEKKIVGYFNASPFVNGGLFECLDEVEQNGKTYSWDGFSNNDRYSKTGNHPREWDGSLKTALIPDRLFFGDETTVDLSEFFEKDKSAKAVKVRGIINILKDYVFTIEENTPLDEDVALDPELLGKVFENLLGCYNEETRQMARNATGSFYTPREIVNYMVKVSLKFYLKRACPKVVPAEIDVLVDGTSELADMPSVKEFAKDILTALFRAKILDPACGSGAFPMGTMSAMVEILRSVDPDNKHWYEIVLKESLDEAAAIADISDDQERAELKTQIEYDFKERVDHPDYARKLYIIEHCIFGSDIQPIAVQISRLRFFITLLCEQTKNDDPQKNYGITPLPNLESNFVAANSLLSIDLKDMRELLGEKKIVKLVRELRSIRHQLFLPKTSDKKKRLQEKDAKLRKSIAVAVEGLYDTQLKDNVAVIEKELEKINSELAALTPDDCKDTVKTVRDDLFDETITRSIVCPSKEKSLLRRRRDAETLIHNIQNDSRKKRLLNNVKRLVAWNPFAFNVAESFLDPEWMFGVKEGFDVVIGNPPYIQLQSDHGKLGDLYKPCGYETFAKTGDIYCLFYERGWQLLKANGHLCYITSNKWMRAGYGEATRKFFAEKTDPQLLIDFAGEKIFESATVDTNILLFEKSSRNRGETSCCIGTSDCRKDLSVFVKHAATLCAFTSSDSWVILSPIEQSIKRKIEAIGTPLKDWGIQINYGIKTGCNEAFIIDEAKRAEILSWCHDANERKRTEQILRPILRGRDIKRYAYEWAHLYIIATFPAKHLDIEDYPAVKKYLLSFGVERLEQTGKEHIINGERIKSRKKSGNKWFETQDTIAYMDDFCKPKIVWADLARTGNAFIYDEYGFTSPNTTYLIASDDRTLLKYLIGVLNSKVILMYLDWISAKLDETGWRWFKQYVETFPIPSATRMQRAKIAVLVDKIIEAKKRNLNSDTSNLENQIDEFVFGLYGFASDEIVVVDSR